jgi:DNA-binding SARP family transcriptional activator
VVGETLGPASGAEPRLRIYLAGSIALLGADGEMVDERALAGRQGRRLFVRLAAIHQPVPHIELADDLWGLDWPGEWQISLRALISKLRGALARVGAPGSITSADGAYRLHLPADGWLDLDAAAEAIHRGETMLSAGDVSGASGWALAARAISSRPLLPGEEGEWLEPLRRRLTDVRLRSLEALGAIWITRGDPGLAARDAAEAIEIDPYRESAHRLLIRALVASGDRASAARAYATCQRLLADELGIDPSPETVALARSLLVPS